MSLRFAFSSCIPLEESRSDELLYTGDMRVTKCHNQETGRSTINLLCHKIREHDVSTNALGGSAGTTTNFSSLSLTHYLLVLLLSLLLLLVVLLIIALLLPRDNTQRASECRGRRKGDLEEEPTGRESRLAGYQNRLQNRARLPLNFPVVERRRRLTNLALNLAILGGNRKGERPDTRQQCHNQGH